METYTIGVDFGTQSGRAVLVRTQDGMIAAQKELAYPHGIWESQLPSGKHLPTGSVLQDPQDYIDILCTLIPELLAAVPAAAVIGIAVDATACTLLPVDKDYMPLCRNKEFQNEPHAYLKLWKHHSPEREAAQIDRVIAQRGESFIQAYGGKCQTEWLFPKLLETLHHAPDVYRHAYRFMDVSDWLTTLLCGVETRNSCAASYKAFWRKGIGFPSPDFFAAIDPALRTVVADKLGTNVNPIGTKAGNLTETAAKALGLPAGIAVSVAHTDAHVAPPAVGITTPGKLLMIIGTSTCTMLLSDRYATIPGVSGVVADGIVPGLYAYEAGQPAVGDLLNWVSTQAVSADILAASGGRSCHNLLTQKAAALAPGESGLVMLDWFNGNRSILADTELSGVAAGLTLRTRPEELYRAAIEAVAFGQRAILENFRNHGMPVDTLYACGGIPQKNSLFMQIYADVLKMPITITDAEQLPATGAAIFAAVAAGAYENIFTASQAMHRPLGKTYYPTAQNAPVYDRLYQLYMQLHQHFGQQSDLMHQLREIQRTASRSAGAMLPEI